MNLAPVLVQRFFDANGNPLAGGQLFTYVAGTTTPQKSYSNATGTENTNPVVLDGNGYADVWLDPTLAYKFVLKDASGVLIRSVDNVTSSGDGATALAWNPNTIYAQGNLVADSSGQGLLYVSLIANNQNNALSNASSWRVFNGNVRTVSANTTLSVTDDLVRSNSTSGALTHTLPACATTPIGKRIAVKDVGTGGFATTIKGSGSDLVDGNNTYAETLKANHSRAFENNGTSWDVLGGVGAKQIAAAMIGDGVITTTQISGTAGITGSQLASKTVTASQIADATVTGTQIASSVALGGTPVSQSETLVVAASNYATSTRLVYGWVAASGGPIGGAGFTSTKTGPGVYSVTLNTAMGTDAFVCITPISADMTAQVTPIDHSHYTVTLFSAGVATDSDFMMIAVGPR